MSLGTSVKTEGYIYGLFDPRSYCYPRYVGKAVDVDARLNHHLMPSQLTARTKKNSWIKSLLSQDVKPIIHILETVELEKLDEAECRHISLWRSNIGNLLTNGTNGGTGGAITDPDTIERRRKLITGRKVSAETRRKMSESHKARLASPEARKKYSETAKKFGIKPPTMVGENNPTSKLTDAQVREIRERSCAGETVKDLAPIFKVSKTQISDIATGKSRRTAGGPLRAPLKHN